MSTDERIEEPTVPPAPIPKDGYYWADVVFDTGGIRRIAVRVRGGRVLSATGFGTEMIAREFEEMNPVAAVRIWPEEAAVEIETLRAANAALVEKVKRLEAEGDCMADAIDKYGSYGHSHLPRYWREAKGQP